MLNDLVGPFEATLTLRDRSTGQVVMTLSLGDILGFNWRMGENILAHACIDDLETLRPSTPRRAASRWPRMIVASCSTPSPISPQAGYAARCTSRPA